MELLSGFPLFLQQFKALFRKNAILAWRNRRPTIIQLLSPLFFLSIIFFANKAIYLFSRTAGDKPPLVSPPIPPCEDKFFFRAPCYDFVWSGNASARAGRIVSAIMRNNPGRPISEDRVRSFGTPDEVDDWLLSNPLRCPGALHFADRSATAMGYGIQTNSTAARKGGVLEDATFKFQVPLLVAAEREIARSLLGDPNFSWVAGFKEFAPPAPVDTSADVGSMARSFFLAAATFGFVFQIASVVTEKELKLRQAMSIMGIYESTYWLSWLAWETLLTLISALLTVICGTMFGFDFFLKNSFAIVFLTFFLFQLNMLAFAFTISAFISKSSSASTVGFLIFLITDSSQGFLTFLLYRQGTDLTYTVLGTLYPPSLFGKAVEMLTEATSFPEASGVSWSQRGECSPMDPKCIMTLEKIFWCYVATFFFWFILAIYLDNVIPNSSGSRKSVFYFLKPSYWKGEDGDKAEEGSLFSRAGTSPPPEDVVPDDEDVLAEETAVKCQVAENETYPTVAIQIRGLVKSYPGATSIGCCKLSKSPPYHAVKGVWLNLPNNQLFCLLGPNGAGKTTTISCLTGITPVTGGDALIYGCSVRSSVGMSKIRRMIGVCPQFDILWDALSGEEHLHLFASIKGLPPNMIEAAADKLLEDVRLTSAAKCRSGSYSGGMKRRLSVAVALIGDPKVVFLDEPTTGMDPLSRRNVWDIIEDAKKGRAIVLTTHSMEEADILSDRIGIMAKGRLRCLGTSIRLKSRFGAGYVANVSYDGNTHEEPVSEDSESRVERIKQFFRHHLNLDPKEENEKFLTFLIPNEKEGLLMNFFSELEERAEEFGISDIQLGLSTLEEVFLNIAKRAELESAAAEGDLVPFFLNSGTSIQIPKGARFVGIPGTESSKNPRGVMVEIHWEQDESGLLYIFDHSPETPIPPNVQPPAASATNDGTLVGFAIDPAQVANDR